MKTRHVLFLVLAIAAVLLFLTLRTKHHNHHRRRHHKMRVSADAQPVQKKTPCDYLAEDQPKTINACNSYLSMCGLSSTANEVLNLEESSEGSNDSRVLRWLTDDLEMVKKSGKASCAPAMLCPQGQNDCPPEFDLKCVNKACL